MHAIPFPPDAAPDTAVGSDEGTVGQQVSTSSSSDDDSGNGGGDKDPPGMMGGMMGTTMNTPLGMNTAQGPAGSVSTGTSTTPGGYASSSGAALCRSDEAPFLTAVRRRHRVS